MIFQNLLIFPEYDLFLTLNYEFLKLALRLHLLGDEVLVNILDSVEIILTLLIQLSGTLNFTLDLQMALLEFLKSLFVSF